MTDFNRLSRLPQSPEYWDRLGARINTEAAPLITDASSRDAWPRLAVGVSVLAAAAACVLLVLPAPVVEPSISGGLAPADPVAAELLTLDAPPTVSALFAAHLQDPE